MRFSGSDAGQGDNQGEFRRHADDLPESPETYWRWGIPSLLLGTITVSLGLASQFLVQPRIVSRYEAVVRQAMEKERVEALASDESRKVREGGAKKVGPIEAVEIESEDAILEQIEFFKNAELAAQRLVVEQPESSEHRYAAARIALWVSSRYWKLVQLTIGIGDESTRLGYEQSAIAARDRAEDAMRSAQRFPGAGKLLAEKWSIGEQLNRTRLFSKDAAASMKALVRRIEVLQGEHPGDREWLRLLGRSRMMLALCPDGELTNEQRIGLAEQAEEAFMRCLEKDSEDRLDGAEGGFVDRVWLAEAIAVRNRELSSHWAKESLLRRHSQGTAKGAGGSEEESAESIDALFRALLFMGSTEEAFAAFESRRDQVILPERSATQTLVASSCVRSSVLRAMVAREEDGSLNDGKFVRLVMRLAPQSSDARALLDAWVNESPIAGRLFESERAAEGAEDPAVAWVIRWLRRERLAASAGDAGEPSRVFPEGWTARQLDTEVLVGTVPLLLEWVGRKELTSQRALELVDAMRRASPENLDLVYASAILALQVRQYDRAISDLRRLLDAVPGNAQLENLLLAAYENATASQSRSLKGLEQSARGTPAGEGR